MEKVMDYLSQELVVDKNIVSLKVLLSDTLVSFVSIGDVWFPKPGDGHTRKRGEKVRL